jgi:polyribonucleotide nucleotidyltransferase
MIEVKLIAKDQKTGKLKLSRKALLPKPEGWVEREPRERKPRPEGEKSDKGEKRGERGPRRDRH